MGSDTQQRFLAVYQLLAFTAGHAKATRVLLRCHFLMFGELEEKI